MPPAVRPIASNCASQPLRRAPLTRSGVGSGATRTNGAAAAAARWPTNVRRFIQRMIGPRHKAVNMSPHALYPRGPLRNEAGRSDALPTPRWMVMKQQSALLPRSSASSLASPGQPRHRASWRLNRRRCEGAGVFHRHRSRRLDGRRLGDAGRSRWPGVSLDGARSRQSLVRSSSTWRFVRVRREGDCWRRADPVERLPSRDPRRLRALRAVRQAASTPGDAHGAGEPAGPPR